MLLAIDIGNTEITLGLFRGDNLTLQWRLTTVLERTPDEWAAMLTGYLTNAGHSTHEVRAAIYASVSPHVAAMLAEGISRALSLKPDAVTAGTDLPVRLEVEDPLSVGADRVVNTLAAARLYERDTIVVDFGTATTFDCVTRDGTFLGGVIAPGVKTAADHLIARAAKLFATELVAPSTVIGRRTEDCIRAGVLLGGVDAVDGLVRRIKKEWPGRETPYVVATGGLAGLIASISEEIEHVEPDLTLRGLRIAASEMGMQW